MSIDGGLRPLFRTHLRAGFQWTSIESGGTVQGIPDSEFCAGGVSRWVEFKKTNAWSVGLSKEQASWHRVRALRGGVSFVAVRRLTVAGVRKGEAVDELWLYRGEHAQDLKDLGLRGGVPCLGIWSGGPSGWNWSDVRNLLLRP